MKLLRFIVVLAVIGYAGWLAWPFISPFFEGAAPEAAAMRSGAAIDTGGDVTTIALWVGAVALYLIAALLLGSGNGKAAVAYFLGFIADAVLRLALSPRGSSASTDIATRSAEATPTVGGVEPTWVVLAALVVVGLLIVVVTQRRRRKRVAGQLAA